MTMYEAIEILKGEPGPQFILEGKRAYEAVLLGIEALEFRLRWEQQEGTIRPCTERR